MKLFCKLGLHKWVYSLSEAQEKNPNFKILLNTDDNVSKDLWYCKKCKKRRFIKL